MKYGFIREHCQDYPVKMMCQALGVSASGYYAWRRRPPSQRQLADEALAVQIRQVHQASHRIYGSRRIRAELVEQGQPCGRKRVVRLMRQLGLSARRRPHRTVTTDSQHTDPVTDNLLNRDESRIGSQYQMGD
jgi:putative transposase